MNDFPELTDNTHRIKETILTLNTISYQVAELLRIKEELEKRLSAYLEHGEEGSKTYLCDKHKVTITSGYIYSLDKDEYKIMKEHIPGCFNPVREKISYELDKKIIKNAEKYGSSEDVELMSKFISKKPKKIHVKIFAGV